MHIKHVLNSEGNARERRQRLAGGAPAINGLCLIARSFKVHRREGNDPGICRLNAGDARIEHLRCRKLPLGDALRDFRGGKGVEAHSETRFGQ